MTAKKPKTYYGLEARYRKHALRDFVDFDYLDELSTADLAWLDEFARQYYQADFGNEFIFINDKEQRRKAYRANNERLRDMFNKFKRVDIHAREEDMGGDDD